MSIIETMKLFYPNLKFGSNSEEFLDLFINSYKKKIYEMSDTLNLVDIKSSFSKLTPKKIRAKSIIAASYYMPSMKNTKENGSIFINAVVNNLSNILLKTIVECSILHKQKKVYPSCIILGIANNKELTKLSNKLGYFIPSKIVKDTDSRTTEKLKESLRNKYKGLKYFSRNELLFLSQPEESTDENKLILFYTNKYNLNNKKDYSFDDIVKNWDDYKLETNDNYICWLFPNYPKMTKNDIKIFQTKPKLRENVVKAFLRMLLFYGFVLDKKEIVKQTKPLNRREKGRTIGLFSIHNYKRITRMMNFLVVINMEILSALFFLAMCKAMKSNDVLLKKILENNSLKNWMITQNYLVSYVNTYDVNKLSKTMVNTKEYNECGEWEQIPSKLLYESDDQLETSKKICNITGLNYTGNSCYMDSVLLSIFAIPNKVITDNILEKDLNSLKSIDRPLWSKCSSNIDNDIKKRQNIQIALKNITNSIRGNGKIKTCSKLRSLIKECPGTQPFHGKEPQDSGEFLAYLLNLFQVDIATVIRRTYGSNSTKTKSDWVLVSSNIDKYSSPIIDVTPTKLLNIKEGYDITKFLKQTDKALLQSSELWVPDKTKPHITYSRRKEVFITKSPLVIFNLNRTYGEAIFSKPITNKELESGRGKFINFVTRDIFKIIYAPETMIIKEKQLNLSAIVVHTGGAHYIAFFKCNGEWYRYNNVSKNKITYTGSYDNMLKSNPNPMSHGTLFFYT